MMIIDPITLGDTSFSRPSPKWVYDRTGTLVEVPANTLGVTYDPADLSKAPWALLEPAATNYASNNTMQGAVVGTPGAWPIGWSGATEVNGVKRSIVGVGVENGIEYIDVAFSGTATGSAGFYPNIASAPAVPGRWSASAFALRLSGSPPSVLGLVVSGRKTDGSPAEDSLLAAIGTTGPLRFADVVATIDLASSQSVSVLAFFNIGFNAGTVANCTIRIGLPQLERNRPTSRIKTSNGAVTRAADVVGAGAGLLYSNVPITESDYSAAATYAKDALVHDPATHNVFKSLIDANKGKALTDPAAWNPRGATNRWAMLDQYNNTQTAYPEEILIVLTPQAISEGLYIGNCEADEIELSVVDQSEGLVASEVTSLVTASGTSSYFDWCFRPADRSDYFVTTSLPPYANALVLVAIRKLGGVPKCGMLAIGGVDDFGPSLYGLSAEGKDYSSTTFNFDGTTNTELRPYAKRMSVDVQVDNGEIDYIQRKLFQIRQRPIVWIGGPYGATAVFGRYGSFKIVIPGLKKSDMALQIEGSV